MSFILSNEDYRTLEATLKDADKEKVLALLRPIGILDSVSVDDPVFFYSDYQFKKMSPIEMAIALDELITPEHYQYSYVDELFSLPVRSEDFDEHLLDAALKLGFIEEIPEYKEDTRE